MGSKIGVRLLSGFAVLTLFAAVAESSEPNEGTSLFVGIARPGPNWVSGTNPAVWVGIDEHIAFVKRHRNDGTILAMGAFAEFRGGLMIMRAASKLQAEAFMKSEPFTRNGYVVWEVRHWLGSITASASDPPDGNAHAESTTCPKPKLADMMWLHGQWRGHVKGDVIEEYWSKPSADSMTGMFRWLTGGNKTRLFEFLTITQVSSGLAFRFKHFSRDLVGWEEKDESWDYPFAKLGEREVVFENPSRQHMRRMIYRIEDSGGLLIRSEGYTDGKLEADEFRLERVE